MQSIWLLVWYYLLLYMIFWCKLIYTYNINIAILNSIFYLLLGNFPSEKGAILIQNRFIFRRTFMFILMYIVFITQHCLYRQQNVPRNEFAAKLFSSWPFSWPPANNTISWINIVQRGLPWAAETQSTFSKARTKADGVQPIKGKTLVQCWTSVVDIGPALWGALGRRPSFTWQR